MSNKSLGNSFERELAEELHEKGFWVHLLQQNSAGQPADLIAVRDGKSSLIDCKVCSNDTFDMRRIEENQELAMEAWDMAGNGSGYFAMRLSNGQVSIISYKQLKALRKDKASLTKREIIYWGLNVRAWSSCR